jgi:hypothetical protein
MRSTLDMSDVVELRLSIFKVAGLIFGGWSPQVFWRLLVVPLSWGPESEATPSIATGRLRLGGGSTPLSRGGAALSGTSSIKSLVTDLSSLCEVCLDKELWLLLSISKIGSVRYEL